MVDEIESHRVVRRVKRGVGTRLLRVVHRWKSCGSDYYLEIKFSRLLTALVWWMSGGIIKVITLFKNKLRQ